VALRLAGERSGPGGPVAGIVPIAPAGLGMPRWLRRALPGARLELLDGVGHCPQLEAPGRLGELLLEPPEA
jgi:pimeloyl-ACP methyl ester carboxylesterase